LICFSKWAACIPGLIGIVESPSPLGTFLAAAVDIDVDIGIDVVMESGTDIDAWLVPTPDVPVWSDGDVDDGDNKDCSTKDPTCLATGVVVVLDVKEEEEAVFVVVAHAPLTAPLTELDIGFCIEGIV
jgi:hypothetical protein